MAATREYVLSEFRLEMADEGEGDENKLVTDAEAYRLMLDGITKIFEKRPDAQCSTGLTLQTLPTEITESTTDLPIHTYFVEPLVMYMCSRASLIQGGEAVNINKSQEFERRFKEAIRE